MWVSNATRERMKCVKCDWRWNKDGDRAESKTEEIKGRKYRTKDAENEECFTNHK